VKVLMMHMQGSGIGYYRHTVPARALANAGTEAYYTAGMSNFFLDMKDAGENVDQWLMDHAAEYDVIHAGYTTNQAQNTMLVAIREMVYKTTGYEIPLIIDIDDDLYNVPTYNTSYKAYTPAKETRQTAIVGLRAADAVTVSTPKLADLVKHDARRVGVLPNYADPKDWPTVIRDPRRSEDKSIRLMFAGGQSHLGDLSEKEDTIHAIMEHYDGTGGKPMVRLFFLGCMPPWVKRYMSDKTDPRKNRCFFIHPHEVSVYHKALCWIQPDILWAPVAHNTFNESKSLIKSYDAAMSGAAFICDDWPTYADVPKDCAVKVFSPYEWKEGLSALIEDPTLRHKLHSRLHQWVLDERTIDSQISKWTDFYEEVLAGDKVRQISDVVRPRIIRPGEHDGDSPI